MRLNNSNKWEVKMFKAIYKDERFVNATAFLNESLDLCDVVDV